MNTSKLFKRLTSTYSKISNKGFTLIELLVVCAIITVLAAMVMLNYSNSQKKSRDTKRKADLESLQQAVYIYKDANGSFPQNIGVISDSGSGFKLVVKDYIDPLPSDPKKGSAGINDYYYYTKGSISAFFSTLENDKDTSYYPGLCSIPPSFLGASLNYRYSAPKQTRTAEGYCFPTIAPEE